MTNPDLFAQPDALELTPESFEDEPAPEPPVLSNLFCTLCNVRINEPIQASRVDWKLCDRCYNKAMRKGI